MTPEERDAPLTTYALNDPGLSAADREQIETRLAGDPTARRAVEETRQLAALLTKSLAAEEAATAPASVVTIPVPKPTRRTPAGWMKYVVAASVLAAATGGTYLVWQSRQNAAERKATDVAAAEAAEDVSKTVDNLRPNFGDMQYGHSAKGRSAAAVTGSPDGAKGDGRRDQFGTNPVPADRGDGDKGLMNGNGYREGGVDGKPKPDAGGGYAPPVTGIPGPPATTRPAPAKGPAAAEMPALPPGDPRAPAGPGPGFPGSPGGGGRGTGAGGLGGAPGDTAPSRSAPDFSRPGLPGGPLPADPARLPAPTPQPGSDTPDQPGERPATNDRHAEMIENSFVRVQGINALSTFGVDVDTASYAIVRKYLSMNQLPPAAAVRLEEMVNYFPYADKAPDGEDPYAVTVEMAECPWQPDHRLVRLGLKARPIDHDKRPASNLVFLIDVSGSMNSPNRLPLVKAGLKLLVNQLGEKDRVAMVVYAGTTGVVLNSTPATEKEKILNALDSLEAGGSTNGSGGIQQAYEVAAANFIKEGTNRVILCTDGDWNVGTTSTEALVKLIEEKRETGVFLSVFGFGMGNLRDEMLVKLAGKGNGQYGYIDTLREANKVFVEQTSGTLVTVAKDVKIQVEFNPAVIKAYRLLGYEKRALAAKDFHDDKKDAGEMGAGHVVTALYELVPAGAPDPVVGKVDGLRYQPDAVAVRPPEKGVKPDEAFVVKMRHKKPDADKSVLRELPIRDRMLDYEKASEDFQFAAAVASFAMLLRDSAYKGQSNYGLVLELAETAKKHDPSGYRAEFIELVKKAKALRGK